ncbi:MAG: alanine racemase [Candidatus Wallbacteria bacterium HGW-Wallbacteria-1]|jgi:alanine racemase|uniref:Alanine racemase n=1 Tax=Candidatus Wallbacteria bacterium HGW-Wallbacteria-1 TaxID=2013854 RepID=A0A2N1PLM1_9BACT|nr:MAG: alanine racemase [Candidatus Wallbacteria bacterium HGW-Wallbacteria-1]
MTSAADHSERFDQFPDTCAIVDLGAIRRNILGLWDRVGRERKVLLAVKADGYGHGSIEVSRLAEEIGVAWLGVALVSEGVELRKAGIRLPILKFSHTFPSEVDTALGHDIAVAAYDADQLQLLSASAARVGRSATVHLKADTGMGRIGAKPSDMVNLYRLASSLPGLKVGGVMTHLPVSDEYDLTFTTDQLSLFSQVVDAIRAEAVSQGKNPYEIIAHAANSGGILAHPSSWFDMVRPGIMLYGTYPSDEVEKSVELTEAMTFKTRLSFVKEVEPGTTISYGRTWTAPEKRLIGTIPVGYADGFNRLWTNRGRVLVNGISRNIAGRVCMDQSMVDLGCHEGQSGPRSGDHAVLFGRWGQSYISQTEWARELRTITYEVTCRIDKRVPRVYI